MKIHIRIDLTIFNRGIRPNIHVKLKSKLTLLDREEIADSSDFLFSGKINLKRFSRYTDDTKSIGHKQVFNCMICSHVIYYIGAF